MATVIEKKQHAFDAAKAAGRVPLQGGRPQPGRVRPQGNEPGRAGNARTDVHPQGIRREQAARRHADHGQPAHDHSDGRPHRDAGRPRRRRALGVVQHLLDAGSRRRRGRRRPEGHAAEPDGHPGLRLEGRDARGILVVHERGDRVAGRQRPDLHRRRRRRRDAAPAQGRRIREGRQGSGVQRRRAIPKSGASSSS